MVDQATRQQLDLEVLAGVGTVTRQRLEASGIYSILDLATRSPIEVSEVLECDLAKSVDITNRARAHLVQLGVLEKDFVSASEVAKKRSRIQRVTTGSKNLDELLGGGIETQAITEFYGEFGTGKTQICHSLAVRVQLPEARGGLGANAIYIDTENTFRPERIVEMAQAAKLDSAKVLENIIVAKAYNSSHQEFIVKRLGPAIEEHGARLVVVDSAVSHYRSEFLGRSALSERQQLLNRFMHLLLRIAEVYNIAVVITNQVQSAPDVFFHDPTRPTGGNVVAHTSTYRLYVRKSGKEVRVARMVDSPCHPDTEAHFAITSRGIEDLPEEAERKKRER